MDVLTNYETSSDEEKDRKSENALSIPATENSAPEHEVAGDSAETDEVNAETRQELPRSASPSPRKDDPHRKRQYRKKSKSPGDSPTRHSSSPRSNREDRKEHTQSRSRSRSRSHSPAKRKRSRSRSPGRSSGRDSGKRDEFGRDVRPARRHSPSKEKDSERSYTRSPDRRGSQERSRHREHHRSPVREGRDRRSSYHRDRDRDRDRGRDRRNRDRDRPRRDWADRRRSRDGNYERSRDGQRSSDAERDRKVSKSPEPPAATKPAPVKPVVVHLQGNKPLSSEEIQAKLAAQAELMRSHAQQAAAALNMPTYLNPSVVNPQQYAQQMQKRKLLWSGKKKETPTAVWNATSFSNDSSGEVQAKFRRLMGMKESEGPGSANADPNKSTDQSEKLMKDLENEFERSRAFQLSRGAGGKSGIGLGYTGT